jgi:hypothetical protein
MSDIKYPNIKVDLGDLSGPEGNAFCILAYVRKAMKRAKLTNEQIEEFTKEAQSRDYVYLLETCVKYVDCDSEYVLDFLDEYSERSDENE